MLGNDIAPHCDDTLGGRISIAREACGLSAEDAARGLGVLPASWNAWDATAMFRAPIDWP